MDNAILKKIISYIMLASVFITGGVINVGFTVEWYHFVYAVFALVCLFQYRRIGLLVAIILMMLTAVSLITYQQGIALVWKQLINISFSAFVFYNFLIWEEWNLGAIFKKYAVLCKIVLVLGFVQVIIFAIDPYDGILRELYFSFFPFLRETNISVRFQSITLEPSFIAFTFAPIVFLSFYTLTRRSTFILSRLWSVFFIIGYLLTLSVVAYVGIIGMLLILYFKNFSLQKLSVSMITGAILACIAVVMYKIVPEVKLRTDDTIYGFSHDITNPSVYKNVNLTTYALLSNWYVTKSSFKEHPLTGTGIGTHQITYDRYLSSDMKEYAHLNALDAGGLAFRLLSEAGLFGFGLFLVFLFKFRIRSRPNFTDTQEFLWMFNAGILVMTVLFLIRSGHYTYEARLLFFMIYFYSYKAVNK